LPKTAFMSRDRSEQAGGDAWSPKIERDGGSAMFVASDLAGSPDELRADGRSTGPPQRKIGVTRFPPSESGLSVYGRGVSWALFSAWRPAGEMASASV